MGIPDDWTWVVKWGAIGEALDIESEAKDALRIAEIGYDNGVTTNLDVLDTQVSLSQVEKNLAEGIYDYLIARAQLDRVMGREAYE